MIKVGIVGGTGYTGVELLRLLAAHPEVQLHSITSRSEAGIPVTDIFPSLRGYVNLSFSTPDNAQLEQCDVVFFATPHGVAMKEAPRLVAAGVKIIDLAADFRLPDPEEFTRWYKIEHSCPNLLAEAVYGLPELNRETIKQARIVANPGCYPTSITLGILPLLKHNIIDPHTLIADCKSGVSGAGRTANLGSLLAEAGDSLKAYGVSGHRHLPEIKRILRDISGESLPITFVPHLIPMIRGMHATVYAKIKQDIDLQKLYEDFYAQEHFVDVLPSGTHPETRSVRGANLCRLAIHRPQNSDTVVVLSVIDNLVKGAAGQAVQNMNLMCGFPETYGLNHIPLLP